MRISARSRSRCSSAQRLSDLPLAAEIARLDPIRCGTGSCRIFPKLAFVADCRVLRRPSSGIATSKSLAAVWLCRRQPAAVRERRHADHSGRLYRVLRQGRQRSALDAALRTLVLRRARADVRLRRRGEVQSASSSPRCLSVRPGPRPAADRRLRSWSAGKPRAVPAWVIFHVRRHCWRSSWPWIGRHAVAMEPPACLVVLPFATCCRSIRASIRSRLPRGRRSRQLPRDGVVSTGRRCLVRHVRVRVAGAAIRLAAGRAVLAVPASGFSGDGRARLCDLACV